MLVRSFHSTTATVIGFNILIIRVHIHLRKHVRIEYRFSGRINEVQHEAVTFRSMDVV